MRKISLLTLIVFVLSLNNLLAGDGKQYGKKLSLKETTKVSKILEKPESFVGKKVLINGTIVDVCSKRGCWIEVASDKPYEKIKVKVNDGEIVFPITAKGKTVTVEGEVYVFNLTKDQVIEKMKHEAEEHGTEFDPETVTGPMTIYQIKGHGAVIK